MMRTWRVCRQIGVLSLCLVAGLGRAATDEPVRVGIVPRPVAADPLTGTFRLSAQTRLVAVDPESRLAAAQLNQLLRECCGLALKVAAKEPQGNYILLASARVKALPLEGYRLVVGTDRIRLEGHGPGLFYGMQSLIQLLPADRQAVMELPCVAVTDYPRFGYRGLLLDVGRHYFPVSYLEKLLDLAARYKLNHFQLHLTDNEGWRVEIKKYPRLTRPRAGSAAQTPADRRYYTQRELKAIARYAQARFITIVPEIEMPGHSGAAVAAYPNLRCPGGDPQVLCPTDETFKFVEDVLTEVAALFPGPYLHIGGDEVDKQGWRNSPVAQAIMKRRGIKDEEGLQSYFVGRVGELVRSRGKRMIGWDEILEGGLAPNAVVMSWRGESGGVEAAQLGHPVIMAPTEHTYFDYNQGNPAREPANIGGFLPLEQAYRYDPMPKELPQDKRAYILGAQANVWTEYIATPQYLEYMLFPRLLAFSEATWSPSAGQDYADFRRRLPAQLHRLDLSGVHYRLPVPDGLKDFYTTTDDQVTVELNSLVPGSAMYYSLDGSDPGDGSPRYQSPLKIALPTGRRELMKVIVVAPDGRRSVVYDASFLKRPYLDAIETTAKVNGLAYEVVDANLDSAHEIGAHPAALQGVTDSFELKQFNRSVNFGVSFEGFLVVPADSYYRFALESDDGSILTVDNEVVVDNDGRHAAREFTGHLPLRRGLHKFRLDYFQAGEAAALKIRWAASEGELRPMTGALFVH